MITPSQLVQGVEWVWLVWLGSVGVVLVFTVQALRRWRRPCWSELARGEEGLSYSLSYVLLFPFYLLFVCLVFETTWLLLAKIGTLYAAHAGARSAIVWSSAQPVDLRDKRIKQSVWTAMTPFVAGGPSWQNAPDGDAFGQDQEYAAAYQSYLASGDPNANPPWATLTNRYLAAASRTIYEIALDKSQPDGDLTVTVTYRAPLHIPGAARILNQNGVPLNEYRIRSSATLPNEAPASPPDSQGERSLGIDYRSR